MAAKPLDIHPAALEELKSAVLWYRDRSEVAATKFAAEVDRAIELVTASPQRWPVGALCTRKFVLQRFPYALVYQETLTAIRILAIARGHRSPEYWTTRL